MTRGNKVDIYNPKRYLIMMPSISIVIPAYNEEKRIPPTLEAVFRYLKTNFLNFEIIVVNDGSKDNTSKVVSDFAKDKKGLIKLFEIGNNLGKGKAVQIGIKEAKNDIIFFMDADLPYDLTAIKTSLGYFSHDSVDIVIGARDLPDSYFFVPYSLTRKIAGGVFTILVHLLVFKDISDTQCGFKGFRREIAQEIFNKITINGFCFDVEVIYIAKKFNYSIKKIPVKMTHSHDSKINLIPDSLKMFMDLFKILLNNRKGLYLKE